MSVCYHQPEEMQSAIASWREAGLRVALVPTMGGLHDGHLALVKAALDRHDKVIVSIYVNPTQFAAHEDLARYPRQMAQDKAALAPFGERVSIFAPKTLYADDNATMIVPGGAALPLEGAHRPHFFTGVATVVFKLFQAVPADSAFFGEKDFQQLAVIRQMVRDLTLPITIHAVPTIRAADGLALSSRNIYLTTAERAVAPILRQVMQDCAKQAVAEKALEAAYETAKAALQAAGFGKVDYFCFCDPINLQAVSDVRDDSRLMVAVWLGDTRLIDNESCQKLCTAQ